MIRVIHLFIISGFNVVAYWCVVHVTHHVHVNLELKVTNPSHQTHG